MRIATTWRLMALREGQRCGGDLESSQGRHAVVTAMVGEDLVKAVDPVAAWELR